MAPENDREYREEYRRLTADVANPQYDGRRRYGHRAVKVFTKGMEFTATFSRMSAEALDLPAGKELPWRVIHLRAVKGMPDFWRTKGAIHCEQPLRDLLVEQSEVLPWPVRHDRAAEAAVYKAALEAIRDGMADDVAYRTAAREALKAGAATAKPDLSLSSRL